jgi:hypothetical protein
MELIQVKGLRRELSGAGMGRGRPRTAQGYDVDMDSTSNDFQNLVQNECFRDFRKAIQQVSYATNRHAFTQSGSFESSRHGVTVRSHRPDGGPHRR